jgi:hypothetical protein
VTGIDADTKLIISHFVGSRDGYCAKLFIDDLASRLANRVQLTSDGHRPYLEAIEGAIHVWLKLLEAVLPLRIRTQHAAHHVGV